MNRPYPYRWQTMKGTSKDHEINEHGDVRFNVSYLGLVAHDLHADPRFEFIIQRDQAAVREPEMRRIARAY